MSGNLDDIHLTLAARKTRWIIDTWVLPRVGQTLQDTINGHAVMGCTHLVDAPGSETHSVAAIFDWMCQGIGLQCAECAARHLSDGTTPHRDPRHECCIVCGDTASELRPLFAPIVLGRPVMVSSVALDTMSEITGARMALGYVGELATTPVVWECPAHDVVGDSTLTLFWPRLTEAK